MSSPVSTLISSDSQLGDPFYSSEFPGGFTPWENIEPFFDQFPNPVADSDIGSDKQNQNSPNSSSVSGTGYDNSDRGYAGSPNPNLTSSGSGDVSITNERKMKRKISNKESAKRSRLKKQKQVENLREQVSKLLKEKQERMEVLRFLTHHLELLMNENSRFWRQVISLGWELMELNLILRHQQQLIYDANVI